MILPRLSAMMFLQFFIWGAWYVTVGNYMTEIGMNNMTHWAYTVSPLAAIISPFFLGMIADRYFSVEKVLGVLHILGGIALVLTPSFDNDPTMFIVMLLIHMLCYMPTLGLTNSLAFHQISDQEKQFPIIRVFGTIGWIAAGFVVSLWLAADATSLPLYIAGTAGIIMGIYSFSLPHVPPPAKNKEGVSLRDILGLDALSQLSSRSFIIFIISSLLICIPLAAYYNFAPIFVNDAGLSSPGFKMSFGQMSEVVFMLLMPLFFARLGVKKMLMVGMFAWVLRYALFAFGAPDSTTWMIIAGIALHGICYDFFFVTGQIYVDKRSGNTIRAQAQGFLVLVTYGVGMLIGAQVSGIIFNSFLKDAANLSPVQWNEFWIIPALFATAILVFFILAFKDDSNEPVGASD